MGSNTGTEVLFPPQCCACPGNKEVVLSPGSHPYFKEVSFHIAESALSRSQGLQIFASDHIQSWRKGFMQQQQCVYKSIRPICSQDIAEYQLFIVFPVHGAHSCHILTMSCLADITVASRSERSGTAHSSGRSPDPPRRCEGT